MNRTCRLLMAKWLVIPAISVLIAAAALIVAVQVNEDSWPSSKYETWGTLDYQWSREEQTQRGVAIRHKDSSLLPTCTDEYVAWITATQDARKAADDLMPSSPDFWSAPGCRARVDRVVVSDLPDRFNYE